MSRARAVAALLIAAAACGSPAIVGGGPPRAVPTELVPASLMDGRLLVVESGSEEARKQAQRRRLLVDEVKLWEIRDGDQLVGTLQVTTVEPRLDLADADVRQAFVDSMLTGSVKRLALRDVDVHAAASNDKIVYLWFGTTLYQVLLLKGTTLDPEGILDAVLGHQVATETGDKLLIHPDDELAAQE